MGKLTDAQLALAELYGLSESLLAAAARDVPSLPPSVDMRAQYSEWFRDQPTATKDSWLSELIIDPASAVRTEIQEAIRKARPQPTWPVVCLNRTVAQLHTAAEEIATQSEIKAAAKAARQRAKKLATMAADPTPFLRKTEQLVAERSTNAYSEATVILVDLREALAGTAQSGLAEAQALKLKRNNTTLNHLTSVLRRAGFEPKKKVR